MSPAGTTDFLLASTGCLSGSFCDELSKTGFGSDVSHTCLRSLGCRWNKSGRRRISDLRDKLRNWGSKCSKDVHICSLSYLGD